MFSDPELNKLRWRSRRGMLELDLLLIPFFDEEFSGLSDKMQLTFVKLLEQEDPDLLMWFSNKSEPEDAALAELVNVILDRVQP
ncbi:MAG: succinate dehydrogenase assembly factor 2 [Gammaproteobacteria bacterium]|nr:succinate dehydrogenase assembly factor 2 [Gammaproteobacteria bacterium]